MLETSAFTGRPLSLQQRSGMRCRDREGRRNWCLFGAEIVNPRLPQVRPLFIEASECRKSVDLRLNVNTIFKSVWSLPVPSLPTPTVTGRGRTFADSRTTMWQITLPDGASRSPELWVDTASQPWGSSCCQRLSKMATDFRGPRGGNTLAPSPTLLGSSLVSVGERGPVLPSPMTHLASAVSMPSEPILPFSSWVSLVFTERRWKLKSWEKSRSGTD